MFHKTTALDTALDEAIGRVMLNMVDESPESEEYAAMVDQLKKLNEIKNENRSRRVSPDTLATILANLFGIGIIVGHERTHIITSKAVGFIRKVF